MKNVFKDKLLDAQNDPNETVHPSPEQLKHKIILKGKKLKSSSISEDDVGEVSDEDEAAESTALMMDLEQSLSEESKNDSTKQKKKNFPQKKKKKKKKKKK